MAGRIDRKGEMVGHYRSEMMTREEHQADLRSQEALEIESKLRDVSLSAFTFGDLSFLLDLFRFQYGYRIDLEKLERLREIAQKVGVA